MRDFRRDVLGGRKGNLDPARPQSTRHRGHVVEFDPNAEASTAKTRASATVEDDQKAAKIKQDKIRQAGIPVYVPFHERYPK